VLWILITVLVGLVVINVQLLLNFQRRSARIKIAHVPVRKVINDYKEKIAELGEGVRTMANASLSQLKVDLGKFQRRSGQAANLNAELDIDAQAWAAERAGEEGEEEEELELEGEEELLPDEELQDEESDPRQSDGDRSDLDELLGGRKDIGYHVDNQRADPVALVQAIRQDLEETYNYIESLRTDATLVQQSLQFLGKSKEEASQAA
jgi:hypothetical protein